MGADYTFPLRAKNGNVRIALAPLKRYFQPNNHEFYH